MGTETDETGFARFCERIEQYMLKAVREAKEQSSWASSNVEYEDAVLNFTRAILPQYTKNRFLADFVPFQHQVTRMGILNCSSVCLLKLPVSLLMSEALT
jgi:(1->4)-alpha-D-glucan 1-alpha-D-glucosylmutase